ncbi:MAG: hypothetical protein NC904_04450, partial [Candidatus Omnitrophica bacterium]|nr:hypothetical protein [Candidatus Omnitrophota bacterium]
TTSFLLLRGGILHQVALTFLLCNKVTLLYCGDSITLTPGENGKTHCVISPKELKKIKRINFKVF